jgi:hypothetical protein
VQTFVAEAVQSAKLAPKTVNNALALLKQMIAAAVDWDYLPTSPIVGVKKLRRPRQDLALSPDSWPEMGAKTKSLKAVNNKAVRPAPPPARKEVFLSHPSASPS